MRTLSLAVLLLAAACRSPSHLSGPGPHGPRCAEIQTAEAIGFSSDRSEALRRVAAKDLTEHEQIYLVDATIDADGFSGDTADVLVVLARNPALTEAARNHMAQRLRKASLFSSDQKRVTDALSDGR